MTKEGNIIKVGILVNRIGPSSSAGDLAAALSKYTTVNPIILSLKRPNRPSVNVQTDHLGRSDSYRSLSKVEMRTMYRFIQTYDVIIANHTYSGLIGSVFASLQGKPIILREGNNHRHFPLSTRVGRLVVGLLSNKIVAVSHSVVDSYHGFEEIIPRSKFKVISNGVDIESITAAQELDWSIFDTTDIDPSSFVVGTAGMLTGQKNHETLIRAISHLRNNTTEPIEAVIAGDGNLHCELVNLARELGVSDYVHFAGYLERDYVYKMLHEIDCFAMPSRWEGHSAAALQAMAAGIPCVLSNIPSFRSQYPTNLVLYHDVENPIDLAKRLAQTRDTAPGSASEYQDYVQCNYSMEVMASKYAALIETLIH